MKKLICAVMVFLLSNIPNLALAEAAREMIPTSAVVEAMSRAEAELRIEAALSDAELRQKLAAFGLTPQEISMRVASLSDSEVQEMATQMEQARYGGEGVTGILIIVVLVLLIIFLAKRV